MVKRYMEYKMPQEVTKEVEETARWLLCGGVQGLDELACRGMLQVGLCGESAANYQAMQFCVVSCCVGI
jgi:hypothetical protein